MSAKVRKLLSVFFYSLYFFTNIYIFHEKTKTKANNRGQKGSSPEQSRFDKDKSKLQDEKDEEGGSTS